MMWLLKVSLCDYLKIFKKIPTLYRMLNVLETYEWYNVIDHETLASHGIKFIHILELTV